MTVFPAVPNDWLTAARVEWGLHRLQGGRIAAELTALYNLTCIMRVTSTQGKAMASANGSTLKAYQFVATAVETHVPLRLEIDCANDMEASLVALDLASNELVVEVWSEGELIYRVPPIGQSQPPVETPQPVQSQQSVYAAELTVQSVSSNHRAA